eukprot:2707360-Rhodomonas_salina.1
MSAPHPLCLRLTRSLALALARPRARSFPVSVWVAVCLALSVRLSCLSTSLLQALCRILSGVRLPWPCAEIVSSELRADSTAWGACPGDEKALWVRRSAGGAGVGGGVDAADQAGVRGAAGG